MRCGGTADSHHGSDKSPAAVRSYQVNVEQNLRGGFPENSCVFVMKDEGSSEGKRTQQDVPAGDECVQAITFVFMLDSRL